MMYCCALKKYIQFVEFLSAKEICTVAEPQVAYIETPKQEDSPISEKRKSHILKVVYPSGRIVAERIVYKTLIDVIQNAGVLNVQLLGISLNGVNLVSETIIPRYKVSQKPIGNGLYVMTCSDTNTKKRIIEQISKAFNMGLKVEKVSII